MILSILRASKFCGKSSGALDVAPLRHAAGSPKVGLILIAMVGFSSFVSAALRSR